MNRWVAKLGDEQDPVEVELSKPGGLEIWLCGSYVSIDLADLRVALDFVDPDHDHVSRCAAILLREIMADKPAESIED